MNISFLGQRPGAKNVGSELIADLSSGYYTSLHAYVAFVSSSGFENLLNVFRKLEAVRLFVGVDLHGTSFEALNTLLGSGIETYVVYSPNSVLFHPKVYVIEGRKRTRAVIGSSNLTSGGLFQNVEASVSVDFENGDESGSEFLSDIFDHYNEILTGGSCRKLTGKLLDLLLKAKVVVPEAVSRRERNRTRQTVGKRDFDAFRALLKQFEPMPVQVPPVSVDRTVTAEKITVQPSDRAEASTVETTLQSGSLWIETGKMTGGSRNILDLSKTGRRGGKMIFGSVTFFGLQPGDTAATKSIDIRHSGKIYRGNTILHTDDNDNWRIQLKGEAITGEKLSAISIPRLGLPGGFVNKILVFSIIRNGLYDLQILDASQLDQLCSQSSTWGRGGAGGRGRAYGIIA